MAALTFKVGGDASGLGRAVSQAKGMLTDLAATAKNLAIGGIVAGGAAAVAGAVKSLSVAMDAERSLIAFEALLGSASEARKMMEYLADESKRTGVEVGVMEQNIKRLVANGMGAEDAKELTRSLLDVSGTLGMTSAEAGLLGSALAQVRAKGVASMEELRQQIAERGVPIFEVLAEKIGVSTGELIDMVSKGKVSADTVIEAFQNLEGPLEKFRGGAEKMANTSSGSFARIKAELVDLMKQIGGPMLKSLTVALREVADLIRENGEGLVNGARETAKYVRVIVELFREGKLGESFGKSLMLGGKSLVNYLFNAFLGLGRLIGEGVSGAIDLAMASVKAIFDPEIWGGLKDVLVGIAKTMGLTFVGMLPAALRPFMSDRNLRSAKTEASVQAAGGMSRIILSEGMMGVSSTITKTLEEMKGAFVDQMENGGELFSTAGEKRFFDEIGERFGKKFSEVLKEKIEVAGEKKAGRGKEEEKGEEMEQKFFRPIVSSLGRIGGAGLRGGSVEMAMSRERNGLLKEIARNTKSRTAVYA